MRKLWSLQRQECQPATHNKSWKACSWQARPHVHHSMQQFRLPLSVCRARLPHMDEEIEHMQWQLDKRTHEEHDRQRNSRKRLNGGKLRADSKAGKQPQHVFHDKAQTARQHHRLSDHRRAAAAGSQISNNLSLSDVSIVGTLNSHQAPQQNAGNGSVIATAGDQQQQQLDQLTYEQQEPQYYHLRLRHSMDLFKARDRACKHIAQDGGCYLSAESAHASLLTHLLLLLQHKQQYTDPRSLLIVQPVDVVDHSSASGSAQVPSRVAGVMRPGIQAQASSVGHHSQMTFAVHTQLWLTLMPLDMVLELQAEPVGHTAAEASPLQNHVSSSITSSNDSLMSSTPDFTVDSSGDDSMYSDSKSSSSSNVIGRKNAANGALLTAAGRHSSAVTTLLQRSVDSSSMRHIRVGLHADPQAMAAGVAAAVDAGQLASLHVKGHAAAHTAAFTALGKATRWLLSGQTPRSLGVVLVPGSSHEHVHAVMHGHTGAQSSVASGHKTEHDRRVASDASMAVGGFGAAYYGLTAADDSSAGDHMGLLHKHAQEVWLCVVPFAAVSD